jgi:hypothetical protein
MLSSTALVSVYLPAAMIGILEGIGWWFTFTYVERKLSNYRKIKRRLEQARRG